MMSDWARDRSFEGHHPVLDEDDNELGYFVVVWMDSRAAAEYDVDLEPGYYWTTELPDGFLEGDWRGPFSSAEDAYLDARGLR